MCSVDEFEAVEQKGIRGNPRKFGIISRDTGQPGKRQVSLMEREQISEHAATLGWRLVRSLTRQLGAECSIRATAPGTEAALQFPTRSLVA